MRVTVSVCIRYCVCVCVKLRLCVRVCATVFADILKPKLSQSTGEIIIQPKGYDDKNCCRRYYD